MFEFCVVTLFPELFDSFVATSLMGKAVAKGLLSFRFINPRDFTVDRHRTVDDTPYGGGAGMVMKTTPVVAALDSAGDCHRVLLAPRGRPFHQTDARRMAALDRPLLLFCGRYEGVDERILSRFDEVLSIGDFVLNGGEVAAMAMIEAVSRLLPGVIGNSESVVEESFSRGLLEYPHYTRPEVFDGQPVPKVLLSGHHGEIDKWRKGQSLLLTFLNRPDLFAAYSMTPEEEQLFNAALKERAPQ